MAFKNPCDPNPPAPPSAHVKAANSLARSNPSGSPGSTKPRTSSSRFRYATTRLWNRNSASATGIARKPFALQAVRSLRSERAQSRSPEGEGWCERVISRTSVSLAATSAGCATRVCSSRSVTASIVPPLARQHSVKLGPAPHHAARPRRIGPKLEPLPLGRCAFRREGLRTCASSASSGSATSSRGHAPRSPCGSDPNSAAALTKRDRFQKQRLLRSVAA